MKLIKKNGSGTAPARASFGLAGEAIDRRAFLRRSGLALGGSVVATMLPLTMMKKARAADLSGPKSGIKTEIRRSVCTQCSVGCGIIAEVQNGVWTGQEPDFESPFNLGGHCAKGAAVRADGTGDKRVKYPMKLVEGKWKRLSWDEAVNEIGDKLLKIREESGPDAVWFAGSSRTSNEVSYLQRKFAAFWGTNNMDHQARICHSTTVAGVANTWGYGAMTNSFNDIQNAKAILIVGGNPAEAHPVAMQHILRSTERGAKLMVADPRFTRTAAHAHQHLPLRSGTDVPFIWGLLWHIFENGWEDTEFIRQRVYAMDMAREEVKKWDPKTVEDVVGIPEAEMLQAAKTMADNRPGTIIWVMGGTQHHIGNNNTRAYCILQLALGNASKIGGGTNIFRGHDNVQGATDVGPNSHTLPGYYGLSEGAWKHWARVWEVDYEWLRGRFDTSKKYDGGKGKMKYTMNIPGVPVSRWFDGVLEKKENFQQKDNFRAICFQGHAVNSQTRGPEIKKALEMLDLVVISDPYPTHLAVLGDRKNDTYLLPTCTQFETVGSVTASNRSLQWRDKLIEPLFESKPDQTIMYLFAKKLGFADEFFKNIKINGEEPLIEDILREINRGAWTIGYTGQSPERLKAHAKYRGTFNTNTLQAEGGPLDGEYYGLPWPCWGTPELKHPGTPVLYDISKPVAKGGLCFRARFGVERNGVNLLAEGSYPVDSEIKDGYPEFTYGILKQLGWAKDLTAAELAVINKLGGDNPDKVNWKIDLSGGIQRVAIKHGTAPFGNAKARVNVWTFPDPIPIHREPLYTPRYDLVAKYPTYADRKAFWRLPTRYASIQAKDYSKDYPLILTTGRLVEFQGGGEAARSNRWLAELQQNNFAEIHPADANDRGIKDGQWLWLEGPGREPDGISRGGRIKVMAMITRRVGRGVVWVPFHFGGWFEGKDLLEKYPEGTAPYIRGDAVNTATTYGYDSVTQMQETKATLCQITVA